MFAKLPLKLKLDEPVLVAIQEGSNEARYKNLTLENLEEWTFEGKVVKVGRKYVYVAFKNQTLQFDLTNEGRNVVKWGGSDYILYHSLEELIARVKTLAYYRQFEDVFKTNRYGKIDPLSLDQLERIDQIIQESNPN